MSSAGRSNVGAHNLYEAKDQRTMSEAQIDQASRENKVNLRAFNTGANQPPMAHQVNAAKKNENPHSYQDPTAPARSHGNKPSRGAEIDAELQAEDQEEMRRKGHWGPNV